MRPPPAPTAPPDPRGCGTAALCRDLPGTACSAGSTKGRLRARGVQGTLQHGDGLREEEAATARTSPPSQCGDVPRAASPGPALSRPDGGRRRRERGTVRWPHARLLRARRSTTALPPARRCGHLAGTPRAPPGPGTALSPSCGRALATHTARCATARGEALQLPHRLPPPPPPHSGGELPQEKEPGGAQSNPGGYAVFVPRKQRRMRRSASPPDGCSRAQGEVKTKHGTHRSAPSSSPGEKGRGAPGVSPREGPRAAPVPNAAAHKDLNANSRAGAASLCPSHVYRSSGVRWARGGDPPAPLSADRRESSAAAPVPAPHPAAPRGTATARAVGCKGGDVGTGRGALGGGSPTRGRAKGFVTGCTDVEMEGGGGESTEMEL